MAWGQAEHVPARLACRRVPGTVLWQHRVLDAQRNRCRFSFIPALFAFQDGTLAQDVPMPSRQPTDKAAKSSRDPSIGGLCICGAMRSFVRVASTNRSALYV